MSAIYFRKVNQTTVKYGCDFRACLLFFHLIPSLVVLFGLQSFSQLFLPYPILTEAKQQQHQLTVQNTTDSATPHQYQSSYACFSPVKITNQVLQKDDCKG